MSVVKSNVTKKSFGSVSVLLDDIIQLLASVTSKLYVPEERLLIEGVLSPVLHEYKYGGTDPITFELI